MINKYGVQWLGRYYTAEVKELAHKIRAILVNSAATYAVAETALTLARDTLREEDKFREGAEIAKLHQDVKDLRHYALRHQRGQAIQGIAITLLSLAVIALAVTIIAKVL